MEKPATVTSNANVIQDFGPRGPIDVPVLSQAASHNGGFWNRISSNPFFTAVSHKKI